MLNNSRVKIAVPAGFNNTPVDVLIVGQNSIEDFSNAKPVKIDYSIGKFHLVLFAPPAASIELSFDNLRRRSRHDERSDDDDHGAHNGGGPAE